MGLVGAHPILLVNEVRCGPWALDFEARQKVRLNHRPTSFSKLAQFRINFITFYLVLS